jgi:hypothetical protein
VLSDANDSAQTLGGLRAGEIDEEIQEGFLEQ